jgi:hypothetical protein
VRPRIELAALLVQERIYPMIELETLAERVHTGDAAAAAELRRQLEGQMARIVRRAMNVRDRRSPLTRRIQAEVAQASRPSREPLPQDQVINRVVGRMCDSVLCGLSPGQAAAETIRM